MKVTTNSYEETQQFGESFAKDIKGGDALLLFGNLGDGKTTFVQGLAKGLGIERRIISPTFIIMRKYEVPNVILGNEVTPGSDSGQARMTVKTLYHIDLYRMQTEEDLEGLGIAEILQDENAVVAIEWPEKLESLMPKKRWEISFKTLEENVRDITIEKI